MNRLRNIILGLILVTPAVIFSALAQEPEVNYDKSKVPPYTLPDPLTMENGQTVTDAAMWRTERRPAILKMFEGQMYGRSPGHPQAMQFEVASADQQALQGKAVRKEVSVFFAGRREGPGMTILIYTPKGAAGPVYRLMGTDGLPSDGMPAVDHPVAGTIGYHIRSGEHDVTAFDWEQYLNFADRHLRPR